MIETETDREWMPSIRKPRAATPWHNADRDPTGGRHRVTVTHDPHRAMSSALSDADAWLASMDGAS